MYSVPRLESVELNITYFLSHSLSLSLGAITPQWVLAFILIHEGYFF